LGIAPKVGHLEVWTQCHLDMQDLWIFSQQSSCL